MLAANSTVAEKLQNANTAVYSSTYASESNLYHDTDSSFISMSMVLFIGLAAFIGWAYFFEIDQSVRVQGQIIASARTQVIQTADGGILAQLLVKEGSVVRKGQLLAILERDRVNANFEEARSSVAALDAALIRARAESSDQVPIFGDQFKDYPDFVALQMRLFKQRQRSLEDKTNTFKHSLALVQEELAMNQALFKAGDISRLEVMRGRRQVNELKGEISQLDNAFMQDIRKEISTLTTDLHTSRFKLQEQANIQSHTQLKAPVDGVVKYLKLNTLGGVLRPGDELLQISPTQSEMLIEVKVNPVDIGFLSTGMQVKIKLDAFDPSIYGSIDGVLNYISSDTLTQPSNSGDPSTYYFAKIKGDPEYQNNSKHFSNIDLKPGMTASVDIKTNTRTVLKYLAKPVYRAFSGALTEK